MNGRPQDPINLRPFEFAFTKEKIRASCAKLGLSPISIQVALQHRRVRDDSDDGDKAGAEAAIRDRHQKNLQKLAAEGMDTDVLTVLPHVAKKTRVMVASPSQEEKNLRAAGTSAGAIFFSVGAKAFNAPLITKLAMEKKEEKEIEEEEKTRRATNDFESLWSKVKKVLAKKEEEKAGWADLTQNERHSIISYMFKARGETGVSQHVASSHAAIEYLQSLAVEEIAFCVAAPPCLMKKDGRISKGVAANLMLGPLAAPPLLVLMPPIEFQSGFQEVNVDLTLWELKAIEAPPWLEAALVLGSESASQLVDSFILFKWPARQGGWALGQVSAVADRAEKVAGDKCNFSIYYAADDATAQHRLGMTAYAKNAKSPTQSWVLLSKVVES